MNRVASALLVPVFLAAGGGIALAADQMAPANSMSMPPAHHMMAHHMMAHNAGTAAEAQRMTHALNLLEANGYGDFSDFQQNGKNFTAKVAHGGQNFTVVVDPDANQVSRQG